MAHLGELLAELRRDRGMTQKELARRLHVAVSTLSSYETGAHQPNADLLRQIAELFGVTADYLVGRTPYDMSPSVLSELFVDHVSVQELISAMLALPEDRRRALYLVLSDMQFSSSIHEKAERKRVGL